MKKRKSTVNKAGNYTKPTMRKNLFNRIKAGSKGEGQGNGPPGKAQMLASNTKQGRRLPKLMALSPRQLIHSRTGPAKTGEPVTVNLRSGRTKKAEPLPLGTYPMPHGRNSPKAKQKQRMRRNAKGKPAGQASSQEHQKGQAG